MRGRSRAERALHTGVHLQIWSCGQHGAMESLKERHTIESNVLCWKRRGLSGWGWPFAPQAHYRVPKCLCLAAAASRTASCGHGTQMRCGSAAQTFSATPPSCFITGCQAPKPVPSGAPEITTVFKPLKLTAHTALSPP